MALQLIDGLIEQIESTVLNSTQFQFKKIPLNSLKNIESNPELIKEIQDEFSNYKFLIFSNDSDLHYTDLISKTKKLSLDFFKYTPRDIKNKFGSPRPGYMKTVAKEFFDYRLVNDKYKKRYMEQLISSNYSNKLIISEFQSTLNKIFIYLEDVTKNIINVLCKNNKLNDIITSSKDLDKFGAVGKPDNDKQELSASKLTIFYYQNDPEYKECVNCSEHIDQGFLSLEPISNVSGLEIEYQQNQWIRIDDKKYNLNSNDLILFCGETFQRLSTGKYTAALHRVGKNTKERLTIVYKMKHKKMENKDDLKLHFGDDETYSFYQYDKNGNLVRV